MTRVLFEAVETPRAVGVELLLGARLYRADQQPSTEPGTQERVYVKHGGEVILCGGSFNTPQILMLSGIGDGGQLASVAEAAGDNELCCLRDGDSRVIRDGNGSPRRVHLPGVGRNLQDRYEVTLISEMKEDFSLLKGATFNLPDPATNAQPDPYLKEWQDKGTGLYSTNGAVLGIFKRSKPELEQPDLFIFGVPIPFPGYKVGYSDIGSQHKFFTWAILKAHTRNNGGTVCLRSADPRDTPLINFHYFNELNRPGEAMEDPDLLAVVQGVKFVRGITGNAWWVVRRESYPGPEMVPTGDDAKIKEWILRDAWGHHACGTCRMGPDGDENAVLDSRFRVRGVAGLRVVDASIFPSIPGYFIVTNIYMASEKAADVLIEDARDARDTMPEYPRALRDLEAEALRLRRGAVAADPLVHDPPPPQPTVDPLTWDEGVTGLAISGGGVRSATFSLGLLQAMAKGRCLRRVDFLSSVSGGGYISSFLGRFYDRLRLDPLLGHVGKPGHPSPSLVERELIDPGSPEVDWLRRQSNYLAPMGSRGASLDEAGFLRNFLTAHFVVGVLLFALFGLANAFLYGVFDPATKGLGMVMIGGGDMPIGHLVQSIIGPFSSFWFVSFELILLFLALPRAVGYWVVSEDDQGRYQGPALAILFIVATALLVLGVRDGFAFEPLLLGLALFSTLIQVELAWRRGAIRADALGTGGVETQRLTTRNYLTYDLGLALALAAGALGFAVIDAVGHGIQQYVDDNSIYVKAFSAFLATIMALSLMLRMAATWVAGKGSSDPDTTTVVNFAEQIVSGLLAVGLFAVVLALYAFAAHSAYRGGDALAAGLGATALAWVISLILTHPEARSVVNRSSLSQEYAARLARTYLGASNPARRHPRGANVTEVIPGDDVASIVNYRPHEAGGPIHLINLTVNQTVDYTSLARNPQPKGREPGGDFAGDEHRQGLARRLGRSLRGRSTRSRPYSHCAPRASSRRGTSPDRRDRQSDAPGGSALVEAVGGALGRGGRTRSRAVHQPGHGPAVRPGERTHRLLVGLRDLPGRPRRVPQDQLSPAAPLSHPAGLPDTGLPARRVGRPLPGPLGSILEYLRRRVLRKPGWVRADPPAGPTHHPRRCRPGSELCLRRLRRPRSQGADRLRRIDRAVPGAGTRPARDRRANPRGGSRNAGDSRRAEASDGCEGDHHRSRAKARRALPCPIRDRAPAVVPGALREGDAHRRRGRRRRELRGPASPIPEREHHQSILRRGAVGVLSEPRRARGLAIIRRPGMVLGDPALNAEFVNESDCRSRIAYCRFISPW